METDPHTENRRYPEQRRRRTSIDEPAPRTLDTSPTRSGYVTETGTTIVSLRSTDAVVVAADRRASLGGQFVTNKRLQKVEQLHPGAAIALSGTVGDIQQFVRTMRAEVRLYRHRRGDDVSMSALSTLAGTVLQRARLCVMALLGGVDDAGAHVLELDAGGGILPGEYAAGGSGMQVAYGVLEQLYDPELPVSEARRVAARAIESASERDTASGNGLTVATITREGFRREEYASPGEVS